MKNLILLYFLICSSFAQGYSRFVSEFPSTYSFVSTPNTHLVDQNNSAVLLRGGTPKNKSDLQSLINHGIQKILIIKNETTSEVQNEINDLIELSFPKENITHVPLPWKDFDQFKSQCEMTKQILLEIEKSMKNQLSTYFHCSVGEDRTAVISALWKIWKNPNLNFDSLFANELCQHGYEGANRKKTLQNRIKIRSYLTQFLLQMKPLVIDLAIQNKNLKDLDCPDQDFVPQPDLVYRCR